MFFANMYNIAFDFSFAIKFEMNECENKRERERERFNRTINSFFTAYKRKEQGYMYYACVCIIVFVCFIEKALVDKSALPKKKTKFLTKHFN